MSLLFFTQPLPITLSTAHLDDIAVIMDVTSIIDCVQVRFYILFLHSIAPISILYCILRVSCPSILQAFRTQYLFLTIECWLVAEAISYFLFYLPLKYYLHRSATHPDPLPREEREKLARRCWSTVTDPEKYLSQWFRGARKEDIKRENVKEFIHWAFFNAEHVIESDEEEVEKYLKETERLLGRELPPGRGSAKSIRLTLDSVGCSYRSLFWYFVSHFSLHLSISLHWSLTLSVHHGCRYHNLYIDALQRLPFPSNISFPIFHPLSVPSSRISFDKKIASKISHILASGTFI